VAVLADKKVEAVGTIDELVALDHPWIAEYFKGPRGRAAAATQAAHADAADERADEAKPRTGTE
jgi:phospholipid/cholesterol/gamma-HCH transport system ATP-binding protein